ncbi:MAG TPA: alpha/beta fold hydrolase [Bryobacteraceae bacterium]|nr:alpha/beta fold hydrolase [Bryobacteraceae bacterium]
MKNTLIFATLAVSLASVANAQNIVGDWQGTLKAGDVELRLVLHITKNPDGNLNATLDSVDQGANGIPVSSISLKDSKLNLTVDAVKGTYEGEVNADATAISGTWTQGQPLPLDFHRGTASVKTEHKPAKPSDIDGDWMGTLDLGTAKLRLAFHITNTEDGLTATMDSLDQGAKGIPATAVTRKGETLTIEFKQISGTGRFEGKISKDLATIDGSWSQAGNSTPLVLKRVKSAAELERRRPQNPVKPYPYREEEVAYDNKAAGVQLAASLTTPPGAGPFPAVLLICGSGPHDRDESLQGHRPFLVLADYLTRKGIAVLRADKRGVGKSTGDNAAATMTDFATDAEAGVAYLKTRTEVDSHRIGLVGHSEGAIVAPMVATQNSDVAFLVLMAGPGVPGDQILAVQKAFDLKVRGMNAERIDHVIAEDRDVYALIKSETGDRATLDKKLREKLTGVMPANQMDFQMKFMTSPWFRQFIAYDPAPALAKVTVPVLAIDGEKDMQVTPNQNLPPIRKALAGNKNCEIDELPGLNHLFQTAKTGNPNEYGDIEETMSPVALEKIAGWILMRSRTNPS